MGYESKLYFVQQLPTNSKYDTEIGPRAFAEKIAEVKMSKIGGMPSCFRKPADCYIYADDGDTEILRDKYGDLLYECNIPTLYRWLEKEMKADPEGYRRYDLLKHVLEGFMDIYEETDGKRNLYMKPKWHYVKVLHYGY